MSQKNYYLVGLAVTMLGVIVLGVDRMTVSADTVSNFNQKITPYTIVGLFLLLVAITWFFFVKYQNNKE